MSYSSRKQSAFTLIELLVVIAIIAILAAILFPVFAQAREKARQTACLSNIKQIGLGLTMYNQDYDELMPGAFITPPTINGGGAAQIPIECQLQPYIKNTDLWRCPSIGAPTNIPGIGNVWDGSFNKAGVGRNYTYVGQIQTKQAGGVNDKNTGMSDWGTPGTALAAIDAPADTVALVDVRSFDDNGVEKSTADNYGSPWGSLFTGCDAYKLAGRKKGEGTNFGINCGELTRGPGMKGHMGRGNYIFADGHAKSLDWGQAFKNDFYIFKNSKPTTTYTP